ncbi:glutamate receptor-like [Oratosquilla oratoria]|uniref:glutamate receptor-like n=1 Tax=Oratosquilla oratoria TaxID=337810 RepID=UPI003F772ED2
MALMSGKRNVLKVAVEEWVPWTKIHDDGKGNVSISGPMRFFLDILADKLDFRYELYRPPEPVWSKLLPNGSWLGLLGMVDRGDVEFALGPFGVTHQRETACDFTTPVFVDDVSIMVIRPRLESDMAGFIKPFTLDVWMVILVSMLLVGMVFALLVKAEGAILGRKYANPFSKSAIWIMKSLTQEATEWLPTSHSGRILVTTWLLASLVFMSSYSGILTAMLTVPRVDIPIDSQEDLVNQQDIPWKLEAGSMMYQYYAESTNKLAQRVFKGMSGTFGDCWSHREPIAKGEFAAICDRTTMKKAMSWDFSTTGECHLYASKETIRGNFALSVAFQIKSAYLEKTNRVIARILEVGLLNKWIGDQIRNSSECFKPPTVDVGEGVTSPLNLTSVTGPFLMLGAGYVISVAAFLLELLVGGASEQKKEKATLSRRYSIEHGTGVVTPFVTVLKCFVVLTFVPNNSGAAVACFGDPYFKRSFLRASNSDADSLQVTNFRVLLRTQ